MKNKLFLIICLFSLGCNSNNFREEYYELATKYRKTLIDYNNLMDENTQLMKDNIKLTNQLIKIYGEKSK